MGHAARGTRETDHGTVAVEDPEERAALHRRARAVRVEAGLFTTAATVSTLLLW
ncbi:MAG TPA: hypothetical protein VD793_07470 [Gemmatimonadales bacterium]|nr:hypothetical protein [Gemmatimonadales bacterium]